MDDKNRRMYQNLCTASLVCALVSIFICGILLGVVAVICAVVARKKLNELNLDPASNEYQMMKARVTRLIIVSSVILIINVVVMIMIFPALYEQIMSAYVQYGLVDGSTSSAAGSSIWG